MLPNERPPAGESETGFARIRCADLSPLTEGLLDGLEMQVELLGTAIGAFGNLLTLPSPPTSDDLAGLFAMLEQHFDRLRPNLVDLIRSTPSKP